MHPNPAFRSNPEARNITFARDRAFGLLTINGTDGPLAAHVPFVLSEDAGHADLHLMRSNPLARTLVAPRPALLALSGPDGYVSPDWYGDPAQVPTWNYVAVHLRGRLELLPDAELAPLLERLSDSFEARLDKAPWRMDKVPVDTLARRMRMIQPLRLHIDDIDGTWKLAQNKPDTARQGAAKKIETGFGHELAELAALMRKVSPQK